MSQVHVGATVSSAVACPPPGPAQITRARGSKYGVRLPAVRPIHRTIVVTCWALSAVITDSTCAVVWSPTAGGACTPVREWSWLNEAGLHPLPTHDATERASGQVRRTTFTHAFLDYYDKTENPGPTRGSASSEPQAEWSRTVSTWSVLLPRADMRCLVGHCVSNLVRLGARSSHSGLRLCGARASRSWGANGHVQGVHRGPLAGGQSRPL